MDQNHNKQLPNNAKMPKIMTVLPFPKWQLKHQIAVKQHAPPVRIRISVLAAAMYGMTKTKDELNSGTGGQGTHKYQKFERDSWKPVMNAAKEFLLDLVVKACTSGLNDTWLLFLNSFDRLPKALAVLWMYVGKECSTK